MATTVATPAAIDSAHHAAEADAHVTTPTAMPTRHRSIHSDPVGAAPANAATAPLTNPIAIA